MTRSERHVAQRFKVYMLLSNNDVEAALRLMATFAPKDRLKHEPLIRKLIAKEKRAA